MTTIANTGNKCYNKNEVSKYFHIVTADGIMCYQIEVASASQKALDYFQYPLLNVYKDYFNRDFLMKDIS